MKLTPVIALFALLWCALAQAHKPSDSYLMLASTTSDGRWQGQWDIAVRDLEQAVGVDRNGDGDITWGELRERRTAIEHYASAHLAIASGTNQRTPCTVAFGDLLVDEHVDGAYAVLRFNAQCPQNAAELAIRYSLLFDVDPNHRGLLDLQSSQGRQAVVLSRDEPQFVAELVKPPSRWTVVRSFVHDGVSHILQGYDHILFLVTLLLPAVVMYRDKAWLPRPSLRSAIIDVTKTVSAFTLSHSLTLSMAVLGWVSLPSRFVESTIAATVVLGALNNLRPIVTKRRWLVAFVFGLIHGFGFASVLQELGLQSGELALALFGFNLGVEFGQLAIVALLVPVAFCMRTSRFYRRIVMPAGAVVICLLAGGWFIERAFELTMVS